MRSPSLADLDQGKLSDESRAALNAADRIAEGATLEQVALELEISVDELKRNLEKLAAEWRQHSGLSGLPGLSADEYDALRESIKLYGQLVPVLMAGDTVVDGKERLRVCRELNIEPDIKQLPDGLTADELRCLALVVNLARRQLTPGARRGIIRDELLRDPSRSDRAIALTTGSSHPTVATVRRELEHEGKVERVSTRIGTDGVAQPAARTPRDPQPEPELPIGVVDITLRIPRALADQLDAAAWIDCSAVRLVVVEPGTYALEVRQ